VLTVTPSAARRVKELASRPENADGKLPGLRVRVVGGGCAGLSYVVDMVGAPSPDDVRIEVEGARVYVDPKSAAVLEEVTLDFQRTMMASSFQFRNPAATGTCGCGSSFSV
jgi:iron-sulfur cluster assembly accessory protein